MLTSIIGTIALAYLLGSIPFGLLLTKAAGLGDIRAIGSGNIGATNVMRTGHKALGILTLLLDAGKGFAAVWLAQYIYSNDMQPIAGLFVVLGHVFPVWLHFSGGKGVATAIGVLFGLNWVLGAIVCATWLAVFLVTRTSSLASLVSVGYSSIAAYVIADYFAALLCLNLAALILFTHRGNIQRLLTGSEHSFRKG